MFQRRFCSNLGMSNEEIKAVQETVQKSEEFDIRYFFIALLIISLLVLLYLPELSPLEVNPCASVIY